MCFNIIHHRKTHYALTIKLTTSTYVMVIVIDSNHHLNVFIYDEIVNRICTCAHSTFSPLDSPTKLSP
jgi:hypothetical protein